MQVNASPDSYLYRMNDVSRELYIVAGGMVDLLIEQDDQPDHTESTRSAGQVTIAQTLHPCTICMHHIAHQLGLPFSVVPRLLACLLVVGIITALQC